MDNILSWLYLTHDSKLSNSTVLQLVEVFGTANGVYNATERDYRQLEFLSEANIRVLMNKDLSRYEKETVLAAQHDVTIIPYVSSLFPEALKYIPDCPCLLYAKGNVEVLTNELNITFVGTRRCTNYGIMTTYKFVEQLSRLNFTIVSGLAEGIDGHAHRAALKYKTPTIAVLGSGIDVVYPKCNDQLYEDILKYDNGCIITEYPFKTRPLRHHFPRRNRIMSGLSLGVLVVEAGVASGASITANWAGDQGKEVFAVPGNIDSPASAGTNKMLRDYAIMALSAEDIIFEYAARFPELFKPAADPYPQVKLVPTPAVKAKSYNAPVADFNAQQSVAFAEEFPQIDDDIFADFHALQKKSEVNRNEKIDNELVTPKISNKTGDTRRDTPESVVESGGKRGDSPENGTSAKDARSVVSESYKSLFKAGTNDVEDKILSVIGREKVHVDTICAMADLEIGVVNTALTIMVLRRKVIEYPGRYYSRG